MIIGIDYWNVISHHPYFTDLAFALLAAGHEVHVISAVGPRSAGTVVPDLDMMGFPRTSAREVRFDHPLEAPALKLAACRELGITVFYDDRQDICDLLAASGILALRVPRCYAKPKTDTEAERT